MPHRHLNIAAPIAEVRASYGLFAGIQIRGAVTPNDSAKHFGRINPSINATRLFEEQTGLYIRRSTPLFDATGYVLGSGLP